PALWRPRLRARTKLRAQRVRGQARRLELARAGTEARGFWAGDEAALILTPADVASKMRCTTRRAFAYMRAAGAIPCGESLRITEEKFDQWLASAMGSSNAGDTGGTGIQSPA